MDTYLKERAVMLRDASRAAVPFNALNALLLVIVTWSAIGGPFLLVWLALMLVLCALRIALYLGFREQIAEKVARRWLPWHLAGTALTGALWGGSVFFFPLGDLTIHFVFVLFMIAGMTAGATASGMAFVPAVIAYNAPALLTVALYFALHAAFEWIAMSIVMLVYLAFTVRIGKNGAQSVLLQIAQREDNEKLARSLEKQSLDLRAILDALDIGICVFDQHLQLTHWNPSLTERMGLSSEVFRANMSLDDVLRNYFLHNSDSENEVDRLVAARIKKVLELRHRRQHLADYRGPDGQTLDIDISPMPDGGFVITLTDVSERAEHLRQILHIATHDTLTGLANRSKFHQELERAMAHTDRSNSLLGVYMLDLDDFKMINDSMGHPAGDELLKQVAERLERVTRKTDLVARLGGDEFAILGTNIGCTLGVSILAEKVLKTLAEPYQIGTRTVRSSASIGGTTYPADQSGIVDLINHADFALYRAKSHGKFCFELFDEKLNAELLDHKRIEQGIDAALNNAEFELYFQPLVDLHTGRPLGAEVLLRWNSPEYGMVSPARFLPIAEDSGQIIPITHWVIDAACAFAARELSDDGHNQTLSINLSARNFQTAELIDNVANALKIHGIDASRIEMEITETMVLPDMDRALVVASGLEQQGVSIVIDDFGTGYSSMSYLKHFNASKLKIDLSFVRDCTQSREDQAIIASAITLGHSMDMQVVAEGIETQAQLDYLRNAGCDIGQGYLFARPLTGPQYLEWLDQQLLQSA